MEREGLELYIGYKYKGMAFSKGVLENGSVRRTSVFFLLNRYKHIRDGNISQSTHCCLRC